MTRPGCYEARIAAAPAAGRVMVTVRALTGDRLQVGPLPYHPRVMDTGNGIAVTEPARGDVAWVLLDEDRQPACIAVWEPA